MNKASLISFSILISIVCLPSCNKCGRDYMAVYPQIKACTFKVGSYFIYQDSADQIIDSEYVYYYSFSPHILTGSIDGCENYADELYMYESSFRNGVSYNDTIMSTTAQPYGLAVYNQKWANGGNAPAINLESGTTVSNYTITGTTYPTVYKGSPQALILEGNDTVHTDIYFAPGYGIVKKVEHRPTGDVSWNLIRYHIVQ